MEKGFERKTERIDERQTVIFNILMVFFHETKAKKQEKKKN